MSTNVLGPWFYRVEVHDFGESLNVGEFMSADEALAGTAHVLEGQPYSLEVGTDGRVNIRSTSPEGGKRLLVLSYYQRTAPPLPDWVGMVQERLKEPPTPSLGEQTAL